METLGDKSVTKNEQYELTKFNCIICNYICCKKFNFDRHLLSSKHIQLTKGDKLASKNEQNEQNEQKYCCENCNKKYTSRNGLWKHSKNCNFKDNSTEHTIEKNGISDKELVMMLINENKEMKTLMLEQQNMIMKVIENGTHNTTTHTNSHNKAFNLNFFLNETCKDAMNIMDFVDSIKLQLSDLERVGELGYVEGISNIIVKNLKEMDVTQRPVHCTDKKRETIYIKDENKWEKDEDNKKLHKVVRKVTCKNQNLIPKFKELHPDYNKYNSKFSDQYNKIIVESMGGPGDNDFEKEEKIIQKISREVMVEK
jgi:ribosomal protein L37AE/L43A